MIANRILVLWTLGVTALLLMGFTLPGSPFVAGDVISAADVNAKFSALESAVTALEDELATNAEALAALPTKEGTIRGYLNYNPWPGSGNDKLEHYWMSTTSEAPLVTKIDVGAYTIEWPGEEYFTDTDCALVTQTHGILEQAIFTLDNAPIGRTYIRSKRPDGTPVDVAFHILLLNDGLPEGHER